MNELTKTKIDEFRTAFAAGINGIVKAGEIYVEAIDVDPAIADTFRAEFADCIPASAWSQFEAVGRKWIHPKMIMGGMTDRAKAVHVKRLPYSTQERIFNRERFDLLTGDGTILKIDMLEATRDQVAQLCDGSAIRSIPAQKAWLEARKVKEAQTVKPEVMPYTIAGGKVLFRKGTELTRQEIKRLLQEM